MTEVVDHIAEVRLIPSFGKDTFVNEATCTIYSTLDL